MRTAKNGLVQGHYPGLGFALVDGSADGDASTWEYVLGRAPAHPPSPIRRT